TTAFLVVVVVGGFCGGSV
ncbi:hypothetical protein A2U01_0112583, partial [Trifolium medium]|nr:hypothetical protein [Trifolium medium]